MPLEPGRIAAGVHCVIAKLGEIWRDHTIVSHDSVVDSALGFVSRPGCVDHVEALSPYHVAAVGKLLTLTCLGGNCPSFTFILTLLSNDYGMSVVFVFTRILLY